jgi:hypothetical protein
MLIDSLRRHLLAAALLAATPALLTAAPATPEKPKASPAEKLRADLDQNISIDFTEQSLDKALDQLREQTKINIVLDRMSIQMYCQQMGYQGPEQMPVNLKLKDVKVKSALRSVLTQYNLGYAIIGDTVFVSTEQVAMHKQLQQRVNLDCDKEEFSAAIKKLARETATNLMVDTRVAKDAKAEVSMQMEDVPLETAVRLLSEMAGLKPVRVGNVLFITSEATANKMRADPDLAQPVQPGMRGQEIFIQPGGPGFPGGVVPVGPGGGGPPGIGTVPVNPPPDTPVPPPDKPDKGEKIEKDKGDKDDKKEDKKTDDKPATPPAKSTSPPPPPADPR